MRFRPILVAFSEYMNFKKAISKIHKKATAIVKLWLALLAKPSKRLIWWLTLVKQHTFYTKSLCKDLNTFFPETSCSTYTYISPFARKLDKWSCDNECDNNTNSYWLAFVIEKAIIELHCVYPSWNWCTFRHLTFTDLHPASILLKSNIYQFTYF